jgi:hypothetical protein
VKSDIPVVGHSVLSCDTFPLNAVDPGNPTGGDVQPADVHGGRSHHGAGGQGGQS